MECEQYMEKDKISLKQLKQEIEEIIDEIERFESIEDKEDNVLEKLEDLYRFITIKIKEFIPNYIELSGYEGSFNNTELERYKEKLIYYDEKYISYSEQIRGERIYFGVYLRLNKLLNEIYENKRNQVTHNYPNINFDFNDFENQITPTFYGKMVENLNKAIRITETRLVNTDNIVSDIDKFLKDSYEILGDLHVHKALLIRKFESRNTKLIVNKAKIALDNYNKAIKHGKKLEDKGVSYLEFEFKADLYMDIFNNFLYQDKLGNTTQISGLIEKRNYVEEKFNVWKKLIDKRFSTKPLRGMKDFFPRDLRETNWILSIVEEISEIYCYEEFEAPLLEPIEIFAAKSSNELVFDQSFYVEKIEDRKVLLRPELTPSLARMVAQKSQELKKPIRWYSIPTCFRYEQPQKGRMRSFKQVNFDILGEDSLYAELEIFNIIVDLLTSFGATAEQFQIYYNNRKFVDAVCEILLEVPKDKIPIIYNILDKAEKMEETELEKWLIDSFESDFIIEGIKKLKNAKNMKDLLAKFDDIPEKLYNSKGYNELIDLAILIKDIGLDDFITFTPAVVRGLDYYTSTVFEVYDTGKENIRAIFGGGRYDDLLSLFSDEKLSGIGFGMGVLMLSLFLKTYDLIPDFICEKDYTDTIYIASINENVTPYALELAKLIRDEDIPCIIDYRFKNLKTQLSKANELGVLITIIIGSKEMEQNIVSLKNMKTEEQKIVSLDDLIEEIYRILDEIEVEDIKWTESKINQFKTIENINTEPRPDDERIPILEALIKNFTIKYYKEGFQKKINNMISQLITIINRYRPGYLENFAPNGSVAHQKIISNQFKEYGKNLFPNIFQKKINNGEITTEEIPRRNIFIHAGDLAYVIYSMYNKDLNKKAILIDDARKEYQHIIQGKHDYYRENYREKIFNEILDILNKYGIILSTGSYTGSDCKELYEICNFEQLQDFIVKYSLENLLKEIK